MDSLNYQMSSMSITSPIEAPAQAPPKPRHSLDEKQYYNNSIYRMHALENDTHTGVFALDYIPAHSYLGDIQGEKKYTWEVDMSLHAKDIVWVKDDLVMDCSVRPRCIVSMIRDGTVPYEDVPWVQPNCVLKITYTNGEPRVVIQTTSDVLPGEELVFTRDPDDI